MPTSFSDYRVPPASTNADTRLGWHREMVQTGQQWLKQQKAYASIDNCVDLILDLAEEQMPKDLSRVKIPRTKRQIRELVSVWGNLRPTASNRTDNAKFYNMAEIFNKIDAWWWYNSFFDVRSKEVFQQAAITGTGYASHVWDPDFNGPGDGDIRTDIYSAKDVLLIQPPADNSLQQCYAVTLIRKLPLWQVQRRFPTLAYLIAPDHGTKAWTQKGLEYVQSFIASPLKHLTGAGPDEEVTDDVWPTCTVYETYITDLSLNMSGHDVTMGRAGSSWEYRVPSYGQEIPTGTYGWEGLALHRRANEVDAMLYPTRRRMIATSSLMLEDDVSPWWHGKVPAARFALDDWPGQALGFPLPRDVMTIESDTNELIRGVSDSARIRLDPPLGYDENLVSDRLANKLNMRLPRQRLKLNMSMGDAIKSILPPNYADQPNYILQHIKDQEGRQDFVMGVNDLIAIAKARQVPSEGTLDKIMEMAGPLAQSMARAQERGQRDLGEQRRWLNAQFRSTRRRMQILGENGAVKEDFDFDPGNLIPSHLDGEDPFKPSQYSLLQRARTVAANVYYHVVPNSMARMQQMTYKLLLIQLEKTGFPIDPWTKAEIYEIDNFGPAPEGARTVLERWVAWQHILKEIAQEGGAGQPPAQQNRGRKASGTKTPRITQKDGGTRSTVAQS